MYCGLPIVATNHGGQVDFLVDGENALLINVGDVKGCAESIMKFYTDKKLYAHCSANNKKKITTFYAENVAVRYMNIFTKLVNIK